MNTAILHVVSSAFKALPPPRHEYREIFILEYNEKVVIEERTLFVEGTPLEVAVISLQGKAGSLYNPVEESTLYAGVDEINFWTVKDVQIIRKCNSQLIERYLHSMEAISFYDENLKTDIDREEALMRNALWSIRNDLAFASPTDHAYFCKKVKHLIKWFGPGVELPKRQRI